MRRACFGGLIIIIIIICHFHDLSGAPYCDLYTLECLLEALLPYPRPSSCISDGMPLAITPPEIWFLEPLGLRDLL